MQAELPTGILCLTEWLQDQLGACSGRPCSLAAGAPSTRPWDTCVWCHQLPSSRGVGRV